MDIYVDTSHPLKQFNFHIHMCYMLRVCYNIYAYIHASQTDFNRPLNQIQIMLKATALCYYIFEYTYDQG